MSRIFPAQTRSPETDYLYHSSVFRQQFAGLTHSKLDLMRVFRPGIHGYPVLDSSAFVLWKPRWVWHTAAHRQADRFFPALYQSLIYRSRTNGFSTSDADVFIALALYAVWRYRFDWLYSLSDLIREGRAQLDCGAEFLKMAALLSAVQGAKPRFLFFSRLIKKPDPYFAHLSELLTGKLLLTDPESEGPQGPVSVKRLLWFEAAVTEDRILEQQLFRKFTKNPPIDEDELLDVYTSLMSRGHLFRAQRLLLRHCRMSAEKPHLMALILHAYLINGKYLLYLRRLARLKHLPYRQVWYEALFAILMIEDAQSAMEFAGQLFCEYSDDELPQDETAKEQFRLSLLAAGKGHKPSLSKTRELFDLANFYYLFSEAGEGRAERIREKFRIFEELLRTFKGSATQPDLERLAFFFPVLEDKFRLYESKAQLKRLWPLLHALAGRSLPIRKFLGLNAWRHGFFDSARRLLDGIPLYSAEELHAKAELALKKGDPAGAIEAYENLLKKEGDSALLYYNYGLLLERAGDETRALRAYEEALKLEPGFAAARDKLELLQ